MDIIPTTTVPPSTHPNTPSTRSPEPEPHTPTRIQPPSHPAKPVSFSNGVLKRHQPNHHHHPFHPHHIPIVITYKECLKNHAARLGRLAVDGCGEFMPSPSATHTDPTSLKCAACGCHRNFHRREPEDHYSPNSPPPPPTPTLPPPTTATIEYQPHHRHHPPPPQPPVLNGSPNSSPLPISSSYFPSAPRMVFALSTGNENINPATTSNSSPRKRFRTKFSQTQKEKMLRFAEKLGWKMQKRDDDLIQEFCNEIKVDKGVLKVWMHNNKNTFGKRVLLDTVINGMATPTSNTTAPPTSDLGTRSNNDDNNNNNDDNGENHDKDEDDNPVEQRHQLQHQFGNVVGSAIAAATNGGSSSSS